MKKLLSLFAIVLCVLLSGCTAKTGTGSADVSEQENQTTVIHADYPAYKNAEELVEAADLIFTGEIISETYEMLDVRVKDEGKSTSMTDTESEPLTPYTIFEIKVAKVYKGEIKTDTIKVKRPGGTIDGKTTILQDATPIKKSKNYLFMVSTYENSYASFLNPNQTVYDLSTPDANPGFSDIKINLKQILNHFGE